MMNIEITFPRGDRVEARVGDHTVTTDQDGSAPQPFDLFLASIGTCSGIYVARFCRRRGIDPKAVRIEQRVIRDSESLRVRRIEIEVVLPEGFPQRYREAVIRAARLCSVKKHLENPPVIEVTATTPEPAILS